MRNGTLHSVLEAFTVDAAARLSADTAQGAEMPFELVETAGRPRGRAALYCYRPLTGAFIRERTGALAALPSYATAARALAALDEVESYLRERGETRIPSAPRERAEATMRAFLGEVFSERSEFRFEPERFEAAYAALEHSLYEGQAVTTVIAPLLGVALDPETVEVPLGEGLGLVRGDSVRDAPADAVWGEGEEANVLIVLRAAHERSGRPPVSVARTRFRRLLTALRLYDRGGYALGPLAWTRADAGTWRVVPLGSTGRPRSVTRVTADQEDELRAFCNLVARRLPAGLPHARHPDSPDGAAPPASGAGELAWALARFEMGCERLAPFEALTDHLLALRALLEPEGPSSGRLAGRLAAICAEPDDRPALAERVAHAISLERAVIAGLVPAQKGVDVLVEEIAEHLRALLRDVLCGHLKADVRGVADQLLAAAAESR